VFGNNTDVVFGDINLQEAPIRGAPHNPGSGGWPTIRYFTKETGVDGGAYEKVTEKPMCQELLDRQNMINYVEEYGDTSLCDVVSKANCNEKELIFLEKYGEQDATKQTEEYQRLEGMSSNAMSPTSEEWILRRLRILQKLVVGDSSQEEEAAADDSKEDL